MTVWSPNSSGAGGRRVMRTVSLMPSAQLSHSPALASHVPPPLLHAGGLVAAELALFAPQGDGAAGDVEQGHYLAGGQQAPGVIIAHNVQDDTDG
jgi:hypothetical protein